jgi:hypothetical protein
MSTIKSGAHQNPNAERQRLAGTALRNMRALKRATGVLVRHLLISMHESRRNQAAAIIARYGGLIAADAQANLSSCDKRVGATLGESSRFPDCCAPQGYGFAYGRAGSI